MKNLFMESGFASMNKQGETLCGDYYTAARTRESTTLVLSDGLGSGVKANILSTLSSTILTTLMASRRLSMAECVQTVAETLPMCSERHLAYSTFTIFQFDHLRGGPIWPSSTTPSPFCCGTAGPSPMRSPVRSSAAKRSTRAPSPFRWGTCWCFSPTG